MTPHLWMQRGSGEAIQLNRDVLCRIFGLLSTVELVGSAMLVCKDWMELAYDLTKDSFVMNLARLDHRKDYIEPPPEPNMVSLLDFTQIINSTPLQYGVKLPSDL